MTVVILSALVAYVVRWGISRPGARLIRRAVSGVGA